MEEPNVSAGKVRLVFWNLRGFKNHTDFKKQVQQMDIFCFVETWVRSPIKAALTNSYLSNYELVYSFAIKENKKGRAKGEIGRAHV